MNGPTAFIIGLMFAVGLATFPIITLVVATIGAVFWLVPK